MPSETRPAPPSPSLPAAPTAARKPYSTPVLRHLGSVRDLTCGLTGPKPDMSGGNQH